MAVRSATVGRDRPRSTWDRKPTERPIRSASSPRVTFLCLRRSRTRIARPSISSCLSNSNTPPFTSLGSRRVDDVFHPPLCWFAHLVENACTGIYPASDHIAQAVPGLAQRFDRRGQQVAAGEARVVQSLVQAEQFGVTENRVADCAGGGQGRQDAVAGEALQPVLLALATDVRGALHGAVDMPAPAVVDLHPAQLREHPLQIGPGGRRY